jgi:hypothetical protein
MENFTTDDRFKRWRKAEEELLARMPEELRSDLLELKKNESRIVQALQDEKEKQKFLENPVQFLKDHDVQVSPVIQERLRLSHKAFEEMSKLDIEFRLPNGQIIKPKINIKFVSGEM